MEVSACMFRKYQRVFCKAIDLIGDINKKSCFGVVFTRSCPVCVNRQVVIVQKQHQKRTAYFCSLEMAH